MNRNGARVRSNADPSRASASTRLSSSRTRRRTSRGAIDPSVPDARSCHDDHRRPPRPDASGAVLRSPPMVKVREESESKRADPGAKTSDPNAEAIKAINARSAANRKARAARESEAALAKNEAARAAKRAARSKKFEEVRRDNDWVATRAANRLK